MSNEPEEPTYKEMPFRLALRQEGTLWNAYLAENDNMNNAVLLGSIKLSVVKNNPELKQAFKDLMTAVVANAIKETTGIDPIFAERGAPESERSGHG
jgi:hypothetical protein